MTHQRWRSSVERSLFRGSSCLYPELAGQPLKEHSLLSGQLGPNNRSDAAARDCRYRGRELLDSEDVADAFIFLAALTRGRFNKRACNRVREIAELVAGVVGIDPEQRFDASSRMARLGSFSLPPRLAAGTLVGPQED